MRELTGKPVAAAQREELARSLAALKEQGITPGLAVVRIGDDAAASMYGSFLGKQAQAAGLFVRYCEYSAATTQREALACIEELNAAADIHGILLLMPLPEQLDRQALVDALAPAKDIDGLTPTQVGRLATGRSAFVPATAAACLATLRHYDIPLAGARAVVLGRSDVIGKPVAQLLLAANATVTICHSRTRDLAAVTREADILIAAVGKAEMVTADMVREGAVLVDVGIHRRGDRTCGDIRPDACAKAGTYTPVPGGIGAVTTSMMLLAVTRAAQEAG
ncbi:MAG: bifunctional 5,10-methylenetetrahydrofolate dehydrogenase/5,10-methenyltetrahydrofolate cyclohydrolase [Veillonellaceae bacterium]|nr:bifunctional 5,10-methylenetetrahydrofolate dehydrogenase/5,10-methenyltetrahydrofolate cyclohydrolase [Veillonellaceae bacterium]